MAGVQAFDFGTGAGAGFRGLIRSVIFGSGGITKNSLVEFDACPYHTTCTYLHKIFYHGVMLDGCARMQDAMIAKGSIGP